MPLGADADEWISAEVRRALHRDDRIDASMLRVETRDGVVVLSGVASTLDQVRRALRLAGRVRGVEQIVNRILVLAGGGESVMGLASGSNGRGQGAATRADGAPLTVTSAPGR